MVTDPVVAIAGREVGAGRPMFVIAEAGVNHNGSLEMAHRMIDVANATGVDAIKFQTFKAEKLNLRSAPKAAYHVRTTGPDSEQTWFELLKTQELDGPAHAALMAHCSDAGILFLSTPYDYDSVDLLDAIGVAAYKVASTDANNYPMLEYIASKGRPVIYSTGMCEWSEVVEGVAALRRGGCATPLVMQCTSAYPVPMGYQHLRVIPTIASALGVVTGFSDHSDEPLPVAAIIATALGASVYERHFTLDRSLPGPDHAASLEPAELAETVRAVRLAEQALGGAVKAVQACEVENRLKLRKSIVAAVRIDSGARITADMLECKRPGSGLAPAELPRVIGATTRVSIEADSLVTLDMLL